MTTRTSVVVVEHHPLLRELIAAALADAPELDVVGRADSAEQGLEVVTRLRPHAVVLGRPAPGGSAVETCAAVRRVATTAVVVLLPFPRPHAVLAALRAGARAVLLQDARLAEIRPAVRAAVDGGIYLDPRVARWVVAAAVGPGSPTDVAGGVTSSSTAAR